MMILESWQIALFITVVCIALMLKPEKGYYKSIDVLARAIILILIIAITWTVVGILGEGLYCGC